MSPPLEVDPPAPDAPDPVWAEKPDAAAIADEAGMGILGSDDRSLPETIVQLLEGPDALRAVGSGRAGVFVIPDAADPLGKMISAARGRAGVRARVRTALAELPPDDQMSMLADLLLELE